MTRLNKLTALAAVVVLSGGLAACGGGSSQTTDMTEPTPQEQCVAGGGTWDGMDCMTAAEVEANAIAGAIAAAKTAADALTAQSTEADVEAAEALVTTADGLIRNAMHASAQDTADSLDELAAVSMTIDTASEAVAGRLEDERKAEMARIAAITKSAGTKLTAIMAEDAQTTDAGLGGDGAPAAGAEGATTYAIDKDGAVTISVQAGASPDEDEDTTYTLAMDLGGGSTMHTLVGEADADGNVMTQVVIVSHDRETPMPVEFVKFENEDGTTPQALNIRADGETVSDDNPADALGVVSGNIGMVMAGAFTAPAGTVGTVTLPFQHAVEDVEATPEDETMAAAEVMGTFNGAMGTYKCVATANCTVTVDTKGVVSGVSTDNDWVFIPAMDAMSDQTDYDYLSYGFWLKRTADADGVVTYDEVETFAMAHSLTESSGTIPGSASYSGGATGVYVHHVHTEGGGAIASSTSGHFSADASLTATFAQKPVSDTDTTGTIAPNLLNKLTGTIDNFMLSGGEMNDWSVALAGTVSDAGAFDATTGTAKGGVAGEDGELDVTFYGAADTLPVAAIGEFNADFSNGAVAGAFGVNMDDE